MPTWPVYPSADINPWCKFNMSTTTINYGDAGHAVFQRVGHYSQTTQEFQERCETVYDLYSTIAQRNMSLHAAQPTMTSMLPAYDSLLLVSQMKAKQIKAGSLRFGSQGAGNACNFLLGLATPTEDKGLSAATNGMQQADNKLKGLKQGKVNTSRLTHAA